MNREYHKRYSQELNRDMEMLVFGHAGTPLLVFPTSMGKFFEYEDRGMIGVLAPQIDRGELQIFCTDAVDTESWYNK
ncbi:MAG: esterase, partial [Candidatus Sulfotelmatobacter sp.]